MLPLVILLSANLFKALGYSSILNHERTTLRLVFFISNKMFGNVKDILWRIYHCYLLFILPTPKFTRYQFHAFQNRPLKFSPKYHSCTLRGYVQKSKTYFLVTKYHFLAMFLTEVAFTFRNFEWKLYKDFQLRASWISNYSFRIRLKLLVHSETVWNRICAPVPSMNYQNAQNSSFLAAFYRFVVFFAQIWMDSRLQKLRKFKWVVGCSLKQ